MSSFIGQDQIEKIKSKKSKKLKIYKHKELTNRTLRPMQSANPKKIYTKSKIYL